MIKWNGKSTNGAWEKEIIANDYEDLLETMVDKGICDGYWNIDSQAYNELCFYSEKLEKLRDEYQEAIEEDDDEKMASFEKQFDDIDWHEEIFSKLTDNQFEQVIRGIDGMAYYQEFEEVED